MPNVVGAIRNLCQNSTANKDAVREAGGIAGLVELLKAGESSSAAMKAAETLEVSDPPLMTSDDLGLPASSETLEVNDRPPRSHAFAIAVPLAPIAVPLAPPLCLPPPLRLSPAPPHLPPPPDRSC